MAIYTRPMKSNATPVFVVVDDYAKRNTLVNIFTSSFPTCPVLFYDYIRKSKGFGYQMQWVGNSGSKGSIPLLFVTEVEMKGCYPTNTIIILDLPGSKWKNYNRLIATTGDNKIIVIEEEDLDTGKFSYVVQKVSGWKIDKGKLNINGDFYRGLERLLEENEEKVIDTIGISSAQSPPLVNIDWDVLKAYKKESKEELKYWLTGIFGYPASGKSRKVDHLIQRATMDGERVLLIHAGGLVSLELCEQRWKPRAAVQVVWTILKYIRSLLDILNTPAVKNKKKENMMEPLIVVVEDCPLRKGLIDEKEIEILMARLKNENIKLIVSFESHSEHAQQIVVEEIVNMLENKEGCTAIRLQPSTDLRLIRHIQENETSIFLELGTKNLHTSSKPSAFLYGEKVILMKFTCSGKHGGYICRRKACCEPCVGNDERVLSLFLKSALDRVKGNEMPHVLVSDKRQLSSLKKAFPDSHGIQFSHPEDFRGYESSVVISINPTDEWLLEVVSRSRLQLIIIDNNPSHDDLWETMVRENRLQLLHSHISDDVEESSLRSLLELDAKGKFLKCPSWDDAGRRIGKEAMGRSDVLDENTGAIISFHPEEIFNTTPWPLRNSSCPFTDWGYYWLGFDEEVPRIDEGNMEKILQILKQNGVEWDIEDYPPVPLDIQRIEDGSSGVLESLSVALTGSLLHLPLLQRKLGMENSHDPLSLMQSAANLLQRPIIILGDCTPCTILPQETMLKESYGILNVFMRTDKDCNQRVKIHPVVIGLGRIDRLDLLSSFDRLALLDSGGGALLDCLNHQCRPSRIDRRELLSPLGRLNHLGRLGRLDLLGPIPPFCGHRILESLYLFGHLGELQERQNRLIHWD
ncbi:unnamed protein product [Darwinula stevensoni]|uniref:Uncharacterized protein n=1 Tax=Darwinula stevensoni TaxID=69355 RepID=A0A7R9A4Z3_9CRUS|nr:unnamed protein product [Darwinula stevensoni]CAG0885307.1 unnamed protein product [Darwinula stevensoni]